MAKSINYETHIHQHAHDTIRWNKFRNPLPPGRRPPIHVRMARVRLHKLCRNHAENI